MAKIFWVEDQLHWIDKFKAALESGDFDGTSNTLVISRYAEAAKQAIALTAVDDPPDIAILDARMNGVDQAGLSVSNALRKKWPKLPIIFLSEYSGTAIEKNVFETGTIADFIAKHQNNVGEVLCWRIKAVLRQANMATQTPNDQNAITSGALTIDLDTWDIYWHGVQLRNPENPKRPLAPTPRKILRCLVERTPRPVTTEQIAEYLGSNPDDYSYATYRQHIKTLRRSFDVVDGNLRHFSELCKEGFGIVAFGEESAYCWKQVPEAYLQKIGADRG